MKIIGTKWVFSNKLDENGIVSRNKARLVAQGYNQQECIDYDETYAPVARLESIRILLAYACALDFKLFEMDVKSAFVNGFINEEAHTRSNNPLGAQQERKTRKEFGTRRGRYFTSSSFAFGQPSSSHFNNDDGEMMKEPRVQAFLPPFVIDEYVTTTPSPTTTSSSLTPLNAPTKTTSTNQTSSSQENTSSSFQSKLQISPPSSNEPTSPHPLNPLLDNILNIPPRPLNPQPLQSHPSLDITLSLSPITPLNHIHDTLSPSSPPQPHPPIMGHPLYYNYHDYHGSSCICYFHN
uniref:Copia protein n=1 Tax=Tanacetum cinerariifolium TaxID=118510 RepID=A0A6L2NDM4_TANCI|nr:copia protein [Tanacetum cinerariifolium]